MCYTETDVEKFCKVEDSVTEAEKSTSIYNLLGSMLTDGASHSGYVVVNEMLSYIVGAQASLLYSKLVYLHTYFANGNKLNEYGEFPCSYSLIQQTLGISRRAQDTALNELAELGLIMYRNALDKTNSMTRHIRINTNVTAVDTLIVDEFNKRFKANQPYRYEVEE